MASVGQAAAAEGDQSRLKLRTINGMQHFHSEVPARVELLLHRKSHPAGPIAIRVYVYVLEVRELAGAKRTRAGVV
jgi:hypothetical protein